MRVSSRSDCAALRAGLIEGGTRAPLDFHARPAARRKLTGTHDSCFALRLALHTPAHVSGQDFCTIGTRSHNFTNPSGPHAARSERPLECDQSSALLLPNAGGHVDGVTRRLLVCGRASRRWHDGRLVALLSRQSTREEIVPHVRTGQRPNRQDAAGQPAAQPGEQRKMLRA